MFSHFKCATNYLAKQKSLHSLNHPSNTDDVFAFLKLLQQKKSSTHSQGHQTSSRNSNVAIEIDNSNVAIDTGPKIQPNFNDAIEIDDPNKFRDSSDYRLSEGHGLNAMSTGNSILAIEIGPQNQGNGNNATNATLSRNSNAEVNTGRQNQPNFNDAIEIDD